VLILIPCVIYAAIHFGGVGAGYVWLIMNILFFFLWVAYVHHKLEPELHLNWLLDDVLKIIIPACIAGILFSIVEVNIMNDRLGNLLFVMAVGIFILLTSLCFSQQVRQRLKIKF
jgi:hypothetical protein